MDFEILKIELKNEIGIITIDRPKALNALNTRFFDEMDEAIESISKKQNIRVLIITGEGKAFVAGADIAEMVNMTPEQGTAFSKKGQNTFNSIENLRIPVIGAINGFALGGGLELAMACDFRIASTKAKFGQPEVNLGMIPGYAGTQRLSRLVGPADALYLLTTAELIRADDALRIGLVQKIVEPEELMGEVLKIAQTIASKGPKAIEKVKYISRKGLNMDFIEACDLEANYFGTQFKNEGEEGMKAFLEKRKPEWKEKY